MAAPFVQKANSGTPSGTATTKAVTLAGQAASNMNVVVVVYGNASGTSLPATIVSVADNHGNTYLPVTSMGGFVGGGPSALFTQLFYLPQIPAGSNTITVTLSAAASYFFVSAHEYNVTIVPTFSTGAWLVSAPGDPLAPTAMDTRQTYAAANDLVFASFIGADGPTAIGAPFTQRDKQYVLISGDNQPGAAGFLNATGTTSAGGGWIGQIVAFHLSAFPPPSGEVLLNSPFTGSGGDPTTLAGADSWVFWNPGAGVNYAQINAGAACKLTRIRLGPVAGGEDLPIGCTIQGCNDPAFVLNPSTLLTIPQRVLTGTLVNEYLINAATPYQFYRYTGTIKGAGVTTLDIYATAAAGIISRPSDIALFPCTGAYDLPTYITLSSLTSSAVIHYTTDGSSPSVSSPTYTGPFIQAASCTLQALAISPGCTANGRTLSRPIHIGATEVSLDILYDNRNYRVWAMNGDVFRDPISKYWYRYGNNSDTPAYYTYGFAGDMVYRSSDLRNWDFRGQILQPAAGTMDTTTNNLAHIALHVIYNALNHNYVLWADSYTISGGTYTWQGKTTWTSPGPEGPFTLVRTIHDFPGIPTTGVNDWGEGDFTVFVDTDGVTAYLFSTMGNGSSYNANLFRAQLTSDYTNISGTTLTQTWSAATAGAYSSTREAPAMVIQGGKYFLMTSATQGFTSSDCRYTVFSSPMATASTGGAVLPFQPVSGGNPNNITSYNTQVWTIVTVPGRGCIYHGDQYGPEGNSVIAFAALRRIRLPLAFAGASFTINWFPAWSFDAQLPSTSGAPLAPSSLVVTGSTASWTNNEPTPCKLYLDTASDAGFTQNLASLPVPDSSTSASGVPTASFYRVRAVNASGSSMSAVAAPSSGVTPLPPQPPFPSGSGGNPPFMPPRFQPTPPTPVVWEDGPGQFVNPPNTGTPIHYNGQSQSATIQNANPKPPRNVSPSAAPSYGTPVGHQDLRW